MGFNSGFKGLTDTDRLKGLIILVSVYIFQEESEEENNCIIL